MARTVFTGWRRVTPGCCLGCGYDDDWQCDGRGTIYCSCDCCSICGLFDGHDAGCSWHEEVEQAADDQAAEDEHNYQQAIALR